MPGHPPQSVWPRPILIVLAVLAAGVAILGWMYASSLLIALWRHGQVQGLSPFAWISTLRQDHASPATARMLFFTGAGPVAALVLIVFGLIGGVRRAPALYGSARFASEAEIRQAGLYATDGIIVGKKNGRYLRYGGQEFVLVAAPTRSGKGVSLVVPNLLTYGGSVVVLDIKQENFDITSGFRAANGQAVFLFNPFAEDGRTHRYNPLGYLSSDPGVRAGEVLAIATLIYPVVAKDGFWATSAQNLFLGLTLFVAETGTQPLTLGSVLRLASVPEPLGAAIRRWTSSDVHRGRLSTHCLEALGRFASLSEATAGGVLGSMTASLTIWANATVDAATSANDFDLREVRKHPMSIYVGIAASRVAETRLLLNLLFSQLIQFNIQTRPEKDAALKYSCLLLMDEFTALGQLKPLSDAIGYMAGFNLRFMTIVQSVSQLKSVYGHDAAQTITANHGLQVIFAPRDLSDAEQFSAALGVTTESVTTHRRGHPVGFGRGAASAGTQTSLQRRPLMLPQEVREMKATERDHPARRLPADPRQKNRLLP